VPRLSASAIVIHGRKRPRSRNDRSRVVPLKDADLPDQRPTVDQSGCEILIACTTYVPLIDLHDPIYFSRASEKNAREPQNREAPEKFDSVQVPAMGL
jgi:hypothetical protein